MNKNHVNNLYEISIKKLHKNLIRLFILVIGILFYAIYTLKMNGLELIAVLIIAFLILSHLLSFSSILKNVLEISYSAYIENNKKD